MGKKANFYEKELTNLRIAKLADAGKSGGEIAEIVHLTPQEVGGRMRGLRIASHTTLSRKVSMLEERIKRRERGLLRRLASWIF